MLDDRVQRLDGLLQQVESLPDQQTRETAVMAIQGLLELYGEGLARIMRRVSPATAQALAEDDLLKHLLLVHDLHPVDQEARVRRALPRDVDLLRVADGRAHVRVPPGCAAERAAIEQAIQEAAPDLDGVEFETRPASSFVALDALARR
jgi:hypothetical protein